MTESISSSRWYAGLSRAPLMIFYTALLLSCAFTWKIAPYNQSLSFITPTTSLLMVLFLHATYSDWPRYAAIASAIMVATGFICDHPLPAVLVECLVMLVQAVCSAWWARTLVPHDRALTLSVWLKMFGVLLLIINPLAALAAASLHHAVGHEAWSTLWQEWLLRDTLSANVFFTCFLFFKRAELSVFTQPRQVRDWVLAFALLAGYTFISIERFTNPFIALALPFTLIALYFSILQTGIMTWLALLCIWGLHLGGWLQPTADIFHTSPQTAALLLSVTFIFPAIVGVARQEARQREEKILGLSERLNLATTSNGLGVWEWDLVRHKLIWDRQMHFLYGAAEAPDSEIPINWRDLVDEEDLPTLDNALDQALRGEKVTGVDFGVHTAAGDRRILRMTATPIKNPAGQVIKLVGINSDITDNYHADKLIAQQNRLVELAQREFATLFEMAPGPLLLVDIRGYIKKANSAAHQLLHYANGNLAEETFSHIFPQNPLRALLGRERDSGESAAEYQQELVAVTADHQLVTVELTQRVISLNDETYVIASLRDLTEQKQVEAAISAARREAERANAAKSDFIANMSHEIRTPLNATLGTVKLLQHTRLTDLQLNYLDIIRNSGESLLAILNDILDMSKIEAGRMELSPVQFNLEDVLTRLSSIMAINSGDKNLDLIIHVASDVGEVFYGDPQRLQQVLINLLSNAIKFTERGFIRLRVRKLNGGADQPMLEFAVRDTGMGIAPEKQLRLFSAFSQADNSITRRFGGTGLGLLISKRLVEMMGGTIHLQSREGEGSEFIFTVALQRGADLPGPSAPQPASVLLLEAQPEIAAALLDSFRAWQWPCEHVRQLHAALERLEQSQAVKVFEYIILNADLPASDRLEVHQKLVALGLRDTTAIVMLGRNSGRERLNDLVRQRLIDGVLIQPVTKTQLSSVLNEAVARQYGVELSAQANQLDKTPHLEGLRILLVEDNALNQVVARGLLEQYGAQVDIAADGQQAVDQLRRHPQLYQVILMDVQMPVMDGFTATRIIREDLQIQVPVLAMSAGVMASEKNRCLQAGMADFVAKPIQVDDMLNTILTAVRRPKIDERFGAATAAAEETIFNPEKLLRHVKGNAQRYGSIVQMIKNVIDRGTAPLDDAVAALAQGKIDDARRIFHTLKGSMGNIGAMRVWHAAHQLEVAAGKDTAPKAQEDMLDELRATLAEMLPLAREWLHNQVTFMEENRGRLNADALRGEVEKFYAFLKDNDMQAFDSYDALRTDLNEHFSNGERAQLDQALQNLRFAEAGKLLREKFAL